MNVIFFVMPIIVFIFVIGTFAVAFSRMINVSRKNANSPRLTVWARVVDKRDHMTRGHRSSGGMNTYGYTYYYVTFEVQSGDRMELSVPENEFGLLVVGDEGTLFFRGTQYLGFQRDMGEN